MNTDVIVIGGGLVGSAVAFGLSGRGLRVLMLDGHDRDFRASNANGALVWCQSKGFGLPAYQRLTRESVDLWPDFATTLTGLTGIELQYENRGGVVPCLSEAAFESRRALMEEWERQLPRNEVDWSMIGREELAKLYPKVQFGPDVVGGSYCARDGQVNSLRLLAALHAGLLHRGGQMVGGVTVRAIERDANGIFTVDTGTMKAQAERVVIAAGLASKDLAAQVGIDLPIRPQRGQMLVTERMERFLPLPLHAVSQTQQGTVLIGATKEEVGFDTTTTSGAVTSLGDTVVRLIPAMSKVKLVRQWAGLRVMTPDSHPIYLESSSHPGAYSASCHSGVTLAAAHAAILADAIAGGHLPPSFDDFHPRRFDVSKAA